MNTTAYTHTPRASMSRDPRTSTRSPRRSDAGSPIADDLVDLPVAGVVPFGLPSVALLGGWLLLALMLAGPFALLVIFALIGVALLALIAAVLAPPYLLFLLVRHLRRSSARVAGRYALIQRLCKRDPIGVNLPRPQIGIQTQTHLTSERV